MWAICRLQLSVLLKQTTRRLEMFQTIPYNSNNWCDLVWFHGPQPLGPELGERFPYRRSILNYHQNLAQATHLPHWHFTLSLSDFDTQHALLNQRFGGQTHSRPTPSGLVSLRLRWTRSSSLLSADTSSHTIHCSKTPLVTATPSSIESNTCLKEHTDFR